MNKCRTEDFENGNDVLQRARCLLVSPGRKFAVTFYPGQHFLGALSSVGCLTHRPSSLQERGSFVPAPRSCRQPAELAPSLLARAPCCPAQRAPLCQQETLRQEKPITGTDGSWEGWGWRGQSRKALVGVGGHGRGGAKCCCAHGSAWGKLSLLLQVSLAFLCPFYLPLLCAWVWGASACPVHTW